MALVELQGEVQAPAGAGTEDSFTAGRLVLKVRSADRRREERIVVICRPPSRFDFYSSFFERKKNSTSTST